MDARKCVVDSITSLQSLAKKHPRDYEEEVALQYQKFQTLLSILSMNPAIDARSEEAKQLMELVNFIAHVFHLYTHMFNDGVETNPFQRICHLLNSHYASMCPKIRHSLLTSLTIYYRNNLRLGNEHAAKTKERQIQNTKNICNAYASKIFSYSPQVNLNEDEFVSLIEREGCALETPLHNQAGGVKVSADDYFIDSHFTVYLYETLLKLLLCKDKECTELINSFVIADIRCSKKDVQYNKTVQGVIYSCINANIKAQSLKSTSAASSASQHHPSAAAAAAAAGKGKPADTAARLSAVDIDNMYKILVIVLTLYTKGFWKTQKTIDMIATCFNTANPKAFVLALRFFLNNGEKMKAILLADRAQGEVSAKKDSVKELQFKLKIKKVTAKDKRKLKEAIGEDKRKHKESMKDNEDEDGDIFGNGPAGKSLASYSAIEQLRDPLGLAESLFRRVLRCVDRFDVRIIILNLVSLLIGIFKLDLPNFYPFMMKFLTPKQANISKLLSYVAQSCHDLVSPDDLQPIIKKIAYEFVGPHTSDDANCVGLNSIRFICSRAPYAMDEDLLSELVEFKNSRNKAIASASRSILTLYRTICPSMLHRKVRGRVANLLRGTHDRPSYGRSVEKVYDFVPGTELLAQVEGEALFDEKSEGSGAHKDTEDAFSKATDNKAADSGKGSVDGWASTDSEADDPEDEDGEDGWVRVASSSDGEADLGSHSDASSDEAEDQESPVEQQSLDLDRPLEAARSISTTRFLTDEDLKMIQKYRKGDLQVPQGRAKRALDPSMYILDQSRVLTTDDIEMIKNRKKIRLNKQERAAIEEPKQEGRKFSLGKYGKKLGGLSNVEKKKTKSFLMVAKSKRVRMGKKGHMKCLKDRQRETAKKLKY